MKKFQFRLAGLLRVRDLKQKQVMAEMASIVEQVNRQRKIIEDMDAQYTDGMNQFSASQNEHSAFSIDTYRTFDRYIDRLKAQKIEAEEQLETMQPGLEKMQAKLIAARRDKRVVELLKERHLNRYNEELRRQERRELQELNQLRKMENDSVSTVSENPLEDNNDYDTTADLRTRQLQRQADYLEQLGLNKDQAKHATG